MSALATVAYAMPTLFLVILSGQSCSKPPVSDGVAAQVASSKEGPTILPSSTPPADVGKLKPPLEPDPARTKPTPLHVVFNWSAPCRVPIVQDVVKGDHATRLRMNAVLESRGADLVLGLRDLRISTLDGADMSRAPRGLATSLTQNLAAMTPDAIIAPDGTFRGVDDLNGFVERGAKLLESSNAPELQKLARLLRLPMTQKVMVEDLHALWTSWVEAWLQAEIPAGTEQRVMMKQVVAGRMITFPTVVANRGPVAGVRDLVLLSVNDTFEGSDAERMFEGAGATLLNQAAAAPIPADAYVGMHVDRTVVAAIDPRTARPGRARSELRVRVGGLERIETRDTMFEWAAAVGCAP